MKTTTKFLLGLTFVFGVAAGYGLKDSPPDYTLLSGKGNEGKDKKTRTYEAGQKPVYSQPSLK